MNDGSSKKARCREGLLAIVIDVKTLNQATHKTSPFKNVVYRVILLHCFNVDFQFCCWENWQFSMVVINELLLEVSVCNT